MTKMKINNIKNLNDLRYRKLLLRTEIKFRESEIKRQFTDLKGELQGSNLRSEVTQAIISNPMMVINAGRIAFNLVRRWRQKSADKKLRKKNRD